MRVVEGRTITRGAIALVVVVLHSMLVVFFWKLRTSAMGPATDDRFVIWLRPADDNAQKVEPPPPSEPEVTQAAPVLIVPVAPASPVAPEPSSDAPPVNWSTNAAFHAKRAVEAANGDGHRNLGQRKPGPAPEVGPPTLFEAEENVRGQEADDVNGDPIVRLNKYCYQELEKRLPTARDYVDPRPLLPKCMFPIGSPEPRGDLFEHLKKERPLPEPKK